MVTGGLRSGGRPFECQVATVDIHVFERIPAASEQKYEPADDKKEYAVFLMDIIKALDTLRFIPC